jgi:hypothetical protein
MGFWTNKEHRTAFDDADDLGNEPSGGPVKIWLAGFGLAVIPLSYGLRSLFTGHTRFFGNRGSNLDLEGSEAVALAIAYIAMGAFIHFHYFWGLHPRLCGLSPLFKLLAAIVFLCSFGYTMYRIVL